MPDKALIWLGSSRADLRAFAALARRLAGFQLRRVQRRRALVICGSAAIVSVC
jgi:phage-related protein